MAYESLFDQAGSQFNVDPALLKVLMGQESNGDPTAISPKGAQGLMQLMPDTAKEMGVTNPNDPVQSIFGGAKYLSLQLDKHPLPVALAAYNAGPGAVEKHGGKIPPYPETQNYVSNILAQYNAPRGGSMPSGIPMGPDKNQTGIPGSMVDPFADLPAPAKGATAVPSNPKATAAVPTSRGMVDPFAGLPEKGAAPAQQKAGPPGASVIPGATRAAPVANGQGAGLGTPMSGNTMLGGTGHQDTFGVGSSGDALQDAKNLLGGGVRGASSIGATLVGPILDSSLAENQQRRAAVDQGLTSLIGSDPNAKLYGLGKLGAEVAGTAGAGSAIGQGLRALPLVGDALGPLASSIESGGMTTGLTGKGVLPWLGNQATRIAGGAINGGVQAGLVDPAQAKAGTVIGAAMPPGVGLIGSAARNVAGLVAPIVDPIGFVGRGITKLMTPQESLRAAQGITNAQSFVPGSIPTAAQVGNSSVLLQTEKAAGNNPAVKRAQLDSQITNNDARWGALNGIAQDAGALSAAEGVRSAAAKPMYDAAHQATVQVGPAFDRFAANPTIASAMKQGSQNAVDDVLASRGFTPPVWPTANSRTINGAALDYTSRALGDMARAEKPGSAREGTILALKGQIDNYMQQFIPGVADARRAYAANSVPINTMGVGQGIIKDLTEGSRGNNMASNTTPPGVGLPQITPAGFGGSLKSQMGTGDAKLYGIDPAAQLTLQNIQKDLQRSATSNSVRSPGSDTTYNLAAQGALARALYGPAFQGGGAPVKLASMIALGLGGHHAGGPLAMMAAAGAGYGTAAKLGKFVGHRLEGALAQHLIENPQGLVPYLQDRAAQPAIGSNVVPQLFSRVAPVALSQP